MPITHEDDPNNVLRFFPRLTPADLMREAEIRATVDMIEAAVSDEERESCQDALYNLVRERSDTAMVIAEMEYRKAGVMRR
jgi:hypothetical protein